MPAFLLPTLLVTAAGMTLAGVGSACWGLMIGLVAFHLPKVLQRDRV